MEQSFAILPIVFMLFCAGLALLALVFWLWMLIDCVTNEPSEGNDKIIWILMIVLLGWLGALIYLVVRRPQRFSQYGK